MPSAFLARADKAGSPAVSWRPAPATLSLRRFLVPPVDDFVLAAVATGPDIRPEGRHRKICMPQEGLWGGVGWLWEDTLDAMDEINGGLGRSGRGIHGRAATCVWARVGGRREV